MGVGGTRAVAHLSYAYITSILCFYYVSVYIMCILCIHYVNIMYIIFIYIYYIFCIYTHADVWGYPGVGWISFLVRVCGFSMTELTTRPRILHYFHCCCCMGQPGQPHLAKAPLTCKILGSATERRNISKYKDLRIFVADIHFLVELLVISPWSPFHPNRWYMGIPIVVQKSSSIRIHHWDPWVNKQQWLTLTIK